MFLNFGIIEGLPEIEQIRLNKLKRVFDMNRNKNRLKRRYYEGNISLGEVNLGIALPHGIQRLRIGCSWGEKTVDVLAARSMFDGYVDTNGYNADEMNDIANRNELISEYEKARIEELKYGVVFGAVSGERGNARIRFYSPMCAAAIWDAAENRIECGFAFDDSRIEESEPDWSPKYVTFYTDKATWELERNGGIWIAKEYTHEFGRPMMEAMAWNANSDKPFGKSRINGPIRTLMQGYVRTIANATIGLEFATTPQKYLLGLTDEQYDAVVNDKFKQYVGSIIAGTYNTETGSLPQFGQLPQGTIQPHVEMLRVLSTQFSAASGLTVTDVGVVNDANPTSPDAILAQYQTLIALAQKLNESNAGALKRLAEMAMAIEFDTTPDELPEEYRGIIPHFKNPAQPSVSVTADAAIKIASARPAFSETDVFLEMLGFNQADIRRIKAQERRASGTRILTEEFIDADNREGVG